MFIKDIKNKINKYIKDGCEGNVFILDETLNNRVLEITDIKYMYDILENETEGVIIKSKLKDFNDRNITTINYGTVLKIKYFDDNIDTVMLIDNHTAGNGLECSVLNLKNKEIMIDFNSIEEFKNEVNIVEVVGQFDELFFI